MSVPARAIDVQLSSAGRDQGLRTSLGQAASRARKRGLPVPPLEGQLYRPLIAQIGAGGTSALGDGFWSAALAVQMVHEASLLHDDVLDDADRRRDRPSLQSRAGAGRALLQGDRVLTASYCVALEAGSPGFMSSFVRAVEATVAGEAAQMAAMGREIDRSRYDRIVAGKTGALFGVAFSAGPRIANRAEADEFERLGVQIGSLFQRIDDFLDFCPNAATGKPMLGDLRQRKWTWILDGLGPNPFDRHELDILSRLFGDGNGSGPGLMADCLASLEHDGAELVRQADGLMPDTASLNVVLGRWLQFCRNALRDQEAPAVMSMPAPVPVMTGLRPEAAVDAEAWVRRAADAVGGPEQWPEYFARNSRTFRFASRWFPTGPREQVTGVYAFCRFTDDLVDEHTDVSVQVRTARLDAWRALAKQAYEGASTGLQLLDVVMGETASHDVSFRYVDELIEGVRMDLVRRRYSSMADLRLYTFRVASVVGGWLTELFGSKDGWVLDRAHALGHAMQLTNILRDVGEDLDDDRIYLPLDRMEAHGIDEAGLLAMKRGDLEVSDAYRNLMRELMAEADRHYAAAFAAIPALPRFFQRPVAVAAGTYRGIHGELLRNDCNNLTLRAHTRFLTKLRLGARALGALRGARRTWRERGEGRQLAPVLGK